MVAGWMGPDDYVGRVEGVDIGACACVPQFIRHADPCVDGYRFTRSQNVELLVAFDRGDPGDGSISRSGTPAYRERAENDGENYSHIIDN